MLTLEQQWKIALETIEMLHKDDLVYPLTESVYIILDFLFFNPQKPIPDDVKKLIEATFNIIYGKDDLN